MGQHELNPPRLLGQQRYGTDNPEKQAGVERPKVVVEAAEDDESGQDGESNRRSIVGEVGEKIFQVLS